MTLKDLLLKAKSLPTTSGCYLMLDKYKNVLYVGKAKNLKARVSSYFQQTPQTIKTKYLVEKIKDFEFILTESDAEAFLLEINLIKKYAPKYNIRLKDDRSYPYVTIDLAESFPRLELIRRPQRSQNKLVFGPFAIGSNIFEIIKILTKSFELRDCSLHEFHSRQNPCLLFQIKQCSAPCVEKISTENYRQQLEHVIEFMQGHSALTMNILHKKMHDSAEMEEFEKAAMLRDAISRLQEFLDYALQKNVEVKQQIKDVDIISFYKGDIETDMSIYLIRNHLLLGNKCFNFSHTSLPENIEDETAEDFHLREGVLPFLLQYYSSSHDPLPQAIITDIPAHVWPILQETLRKLNPHSAHLQVMPAEETMQALLQLSFRQAEETQRVRLNQQTGRLQALQQLQNLLNLKTCPSRIECVDVAIWQGRSPTAAQVVFVDGGPMKKDYRHYHLEMRPEGNNDFAFMQEFMQRRLRHGNLPDILIIDGGKGQLGAIAEVLKQQKISLPLAALAKSKSRPMANKHILSDEKILVPERLFIPGRKNPYQLKEGSSLFKLLTQMRDEAHRFSRKLHHKKEKKEQIKSWLDEIPGIGPKTRQKFLLQLRVDLSQLKIYSVEQLQKEFKINERLASAIKKYLENK